MKTRIIILTLSLILTLFNCFGQVDKKERKYLQHNGLVSELSICFDCDLNEIVKAIRQRIKNYPIDSTTEFRKEKDDTLIEIVEFNKAGLANYSYYFNNLLKIRYSESSTDSNDYILTIMNEFEMEQKQWIVLPNETHITDYDENSNMKKYFAKINKDKDKKIEFVKEWKSGKFKTGQSRTYKKNDKGQWELVETHEVGQFDWPE